MMCVFFGRLLVDHGDPSFLQGFLANPGQIARQLGATRQQAQALASLSRTDLQQLIKQLESISLALGPELMKRIADDVGVQILIGRALQDPQFAARLQTQGQAVVSEMLGNSRSAKEAMEIVRSDGFARLEGFSAQRQAMSEVGAGKRFARGLARRKRAEAR